MRKRRHMEEARSKKRIRIEEITSGKVSEKVGELLKEIEKNANEKESSSTQFKVI